MTSNRHLAPSPRARVRRMPERAHYDAATIESIVDEEPLPGSDHNSDDNLGGDAASDLMAAPGEDGAFPTLLSSFNNNNINNNQPDEVRMLGFPPGGDSPLFQPYLASNDVDGILMGQDIHSMADVSPLLGSSPATRMPEEDFESGLHEAEESTIPFMGFPMEIRDLE